MSGQNNNELQPTWKPTRTTAKIAGAIFGTLCVVLIFIVVRYKFPEFSKYFRLTQPKTPEYYQNILKDGRDTLFVIEKAHVIEEHDDDNNTGRYLKFLLRSKDSKTRAVLTIYFPFDYHQIKPFVDDLKNYCLYFGDTSIYHVNLFPDERCENEAVLNNCREYIGEIDGEAVACFYCDYDQITRFNRKPVETE